MKEKALRLPEPEEGKFPEGFDMGAICYWRDRGVWFLYLPGGGVGNLRSHDVKVDGDGSITVSPSILVTNPKGTKRRHGFLVAGVWEPCGDDLPPERRT